MVVIAEKKLTGAYFAGHAGMIQSMTVRIIIPFRIIPYV